MEMVSLSLGCRFNWYTDVNSVEFKVKTWRWLLGCAGKYGSPAALSIAQSCHHPMLITLETENDKHMCSVHNKIPLIRIAWDKTNVDLSNNPDHQMVFLLIWVLIGNFLLLLLYYGCTTNQTNTPFRYLFHPLVQGHQIPLLCFLESS
jgi:hypothetical protein